MVFEIYAGMERTPLSVDTVLRPFARKFGHVNLLSDEKPAALSASSSTCSAFASPTAGRRRDVDAVRP